MHNQTEIKQYEFNLKPCFQTLPDPLIHSILEYSGKVIYRNGVYLNRIDICKYSHINDILSKIEFTRNYICIKHNHIGTTKRKCMQIRYHFNLRELSYKYYSYSRQKTHCYDYYYYILDANNIWRPKIYYEM
jgi:hypothetical protein